MTREEAIKILTETQVVYFAPNGKEKVQEALDMAIEALSAEPKVKVCEERQNGECPFYTPDWLDDDVSEPSDLISRADAIECVRWGWSIDNVINAINALPSADAVSKYTEWLEKIIVMLEPAYLCEETSNPKWCRENCVYTSIQAECLRHLYKVSDDE